MLLNNMVGEPWGRWPGGRESIRMRGSGGRGRFLSPPANGERGRYFGLDCGPRRKAKTH